MEKNSKEKSHKEKKDELDKEILLILNRQMYEKGLINEDIYQKAKAKIEKS